VHRDIILGLSHPAFPTSVSHNCSLTLVLSDTKVGKGRVPHKEYWSRIVASSILNTFAASVRIYRTWKSAWNQAIFSCLKQLHSSSANCARELFKPLKDSASLRIWNEKNFLVMSFVVFVGDVTRKVGF